MEKRVSHTDSILEFLNKWIARPIAIIGAFITIYVVAQSLSAGEFQRIPELFGLPGIDFAVPPLPAMDWPRWLVDLWGNETLRVFALLSVIVAISATLALVCRLSGAIGVWGLIFVLPIAFLAAWAPLKLFLDWFPGLIQSPLNSFGIASSGEFVPTRTEYNSGWVTLYLLLGSVGLCFAAVHYFQGASDNQKSAAGGIIFCIATIVVGVWMVARSLETKAPNLAFNIHPSCSTATMDQVRAQDASLVSFLSAQRPPGPKTLDFFSHRGAFKDSSHLFYHGCTVPSETASLANLKLAVSFAALTDGRWRCDVGLVTATWDLEVVRFFDWKLLRSFQGEPCNKYKNGEVTGPVQVNIRTSDIRSLFEK